LQKGLKHRVSLNTEDRGNRRLVQKWGRQGEKPPVKESNSSNKELWTKPRGRTGKSHRRPMGGEESEKKRSSKSLSP